MIDDEETMRRQRRGPLVRRKNEGELPDRRDIDGDPGSMLLCLFCVLVLSVYVFNVRIVRNSNNKKDLRSRFKDRRSVG